MIQFFNKKMNKKRKGFTLIELIVVVAILGILAAIAIPRFTGVRDSAAQSAITADARSIYSAMEVFYAENGNYPVATAGGAPTFGDPANIVLNGEITGYTTPTGASYTMTYKNKEGTYNIVINQDGVEAPNPITPAEPVSP